MLDEYLAKDQEIVELKQKLSQAVEDLKSAKEEN